MSERSAALPFTIQRGTDSFTGDAMVSTRETVHGLLRLEGDELTIQWRLATKVDHMGSTMSTDTDVGPVRQITVPISAVAGAVVRHRWWELFWGHRLVLTASDLSAFEGLTGPDGLSLEHPAELVLRLRHKDRLAAEEFGAELELAIAERAALGRASRSRSLPEPASGSESAG